MVTLEVQSEKNEFEIHSDLSILSETVNKIASAIKKNDDEIDYFVINEMLSNAIEHGNKLDKNKKVTISVAVNDNLYRVVIKDQGEGFDWKKYVKKEVDLAMDLQGNLDRGRGIIMTKMMSDYIEYNDKGNEVTIINVNR